MSDHTDWPPATRERRRAARALIGVGDDTPLIGTVGNLTRLKDHASLLRAVAVLPLHPAAEVVLVGFGEQQRNLEDLAAALGLTERVHLLGSRMDVNRLMPGFDVYVQPSLSEGFGLAVLEAMATGIPVVASAVGGLASLLADGAGLPVPPGDADAIATAISQVLDDADLAKRMIAAGFGVAAAHPVGPYVDAVEAHYRRLIPRSDPPAARIDPLDGWADTAVPTTAAPQAHPHPDIAARALLAACEPLRPDDMPFSRLLAVAGRERLLGVLVRQLDAGTWPLVSAEHAEEARLALRNQVMHAMRLQALLHTMTADLADAGIPAIVLKGPAAAALDHEHPHDRLYADLDLLVPSLDLDAVVAMAERLGGRRTAPQLRAGFDRRFAQTVTLRMGDRLELDLHRTIAPEPFGVFIDEATLWRDPEPVDIAGQPALALSPLNRLLHACYHAVLSVGRPRIVPLLDARILLDRVPVEAAVERADGWRSRAVLARAILAMHDRLGSADGDGPPIEARTWARSYHPDLLERVVLRRTVDVRARQAWRTALTLPYLPGWSDRWAYLAATAWPSEAFLAARGSDRRAWLRRGAEAITDLPAAGHRR